ncbi:MAG: zinc-binding dehydrogenase [Salinibacterium sp.]|nr:zinc-binding dehydrogenase [Salinibacterium sp.]
MTSLPTTGAAIVMPAEGGPLRLVQRPVDTPAAGEALVRIEACGVCGSDAFLQDGGFGPGSLPRVPGHEAAGVVIAVGDAQDAEWIGRQVALYYIEGPAESAWAEAGHENIGPGIQRMGVDVDGAFAQYVVRRITTLIPVEPRMDPASVAVATDALATPYHALTAIAGLASGETLAIIGLGGIGSNAVQIGRHLGAKVVAVGRGEAKLAQARELGAAITLHSSDGPEAIVAAAGGQIDVVLQCVGENTAMDRLAIDIAGYRARVVFIAVSQDDFPVRSTELVWRELSLKGSRGFTREDIREVLALVASGDLTTDHLTRNRRPLREAAEAIADLRAGTVLRTVLTMDDLREGDGQ